MKLSPNTMAVAAVGGCRVSSPRFSQIAFVGLLISLSFVVVASGQPGPNPVCWEFVTNPNGLQIVPYVVYDADTGILALDTRGINGIDETPDYTNVGGPIFGDDVGLISILVETPVSTGTVFPDFNGLNLTYFITWNTQYFSGKYQIIGNPAAGNTGNQFLWPGVYDVIQLPTGLTSADFHSVEIGVNFAPLTPGSSLFNVETDPSCPPGGVAVVPEPAAYILTAMGAVMLGAVSYQRGERRPPKR